MDPFTWYELGMVFAVFIISGLFNAVGIDGGSVFIVFFIISLNYVTKIGI